MPLLLLFIIAAVFLFTAMKSSSNKPSADVAKFVKTQYEDYAIEYGNYWQIPASRLLAHIAVETRGERWKDAAHTIWNRGTSGEVGITQIMPSTLADVCRRIGKNYSTDDIENYVWASIEITAAYLHLLEVQTGSLDKASRKYNGSLTNPVTATYLENVKGYEQLIRTV